LQYGKVVGRFVAAIGDGVDSDTFPDATPLSGTVTFTPSAAKFLVATASPDPTTVEAQPIVGVLDSNGYLTFNGLQGVWLLATNDPALNPTGFTYNVKYALTYNGNTIDKSTFDIPVPISNASDPTTFTDLTKAAPVASANGTPVTKGDPGMPGVTPTFTVRNVTSGATPAVNLDGSNAPAYKMDFTLPTSGGGAGTVKSVAGVSPDGSGNVSLSKSTIGLDQVDNTADVNKPVSTAQAAALAGKAPVNSPAFTGTPTGISKAHVGLGNVDNTADATKSFTSTQVSDATTLGKSLLTAPDATTARTAIGAGTGTYSKPGGGIPSTDLSSAVQTSLGKADSAAQPSDLDGIHVYYNGSAWPARPTTGARVFWDSADYATAPAPSGAVTNDRWIRRTPA
jgi:hypothetical protein